MGPLKLSPCCLSDARTSHPLPGQGPSTTWEPAGLLPGAPCWHQDPSSMLTLASPRDIAGAELEPSHCRAQGDVKLSPALVPTVPQVSHCWGRVGLLEV